MTVLLAKVEMLALAAAAERPISSALDGHRPVKETTATD